MFFDPLYFLFMLPAFAIGLWAQLRVKSTVARYAQEPTRSGLSGAQVAQAILEREGIDDVRVEPVQGFLSDHYDSRHRVLRLSPDVYYGRSVTAAGVAAHEVGHAIQHAHRYKPLMFRQAVAPAAALGSNLAMILLVIGLLVQATGLVYLGILGFSIAVVFTLVTLPVEFDASSRAKRALASTGMVTSLEADGVSRVLSAAAMTYVAAAVSAIAQLLYFVLRANMMQSRD